MYNPFSLYGKTILITGASSGIGRATAIECSKLGAKLIITGRNIERLDETWEQLEGEGHFKIVANLTIENQQEDIVNSLPEIDGLVNSAGMLKSLPFHYISKNDLLEVFDTNFFAPVLLSQRIIKSRKLKKGGSIVFISSIEGPLITHAGNSIYSASKSAVSAMAKSMAIELASKNIRVNCVLPGMTETPLINIDFITKEQLDVDRALYPLRRYGKAEEIALSVIYLLSDASSWVTGSNLVIDGGITLT